MTKAPEPVPSRKFDGVRENKERKVKGVWSRLGLKVGKVEEGKWAGWSR